MKGVNLTYVIVATIIGLSILGYGYMKMKSDRDDRAIKAATYDTNIKNLNNCMDKANKDYLSWWNNACTSRGLGNDCSLPLHQADSFGESFEKAKDRCVKLFEN